MISVSERFGNPKGDQELQSVWKTQCERVGLNTVGFQYSSIYMQIKFDFIFPIHIYVYEPSLGFTNFYHLHLQYHYLHTEQFCNVGCMLQMTLRMAYMNLRMAQLAKGLSINCISVFRVPNQSVAGRFRILSGMQGFSLSDTPDMPNISSLRCM